MTKNWLFSLACLWTITPRAQTVDFTYSTGSALFCNPQEVNFVQACTGNPISYIWTFGNTQSGTAANETITYLQPGNYTVTLTAIFANEAKSISKTISINPTPTLTLTADYNSLCQPGIINFNATGSAFIVGFEWEFGDGTGVQTGSSNTISHYYANYGNFKVKVKGTTANGCTVIKTLDVDVTKFIVSGSVSPIKGCVPINANFNAGTNLPASNQAMNYFWDFGDGSQVSNNSGNSINHIYPVPVTINSASVVITSLQGCFNKFTFPPLAFGIPPGNNNVYTTALKDTFCGSETVNFYCKAANANMYKWEFGDGKSVSTADTLVSHRYVKLGKQVVVITPFYNGCPGKSDTLHLFIKGVIANFGYSNNCLYKHQYQFSNSSAGNITHFEWTFEDAPALIDSVNYNAPHNFPLIGTFFTKLFLQDSITGCTDLFTGTIYTARPKFIRSAPSVCKDSLITYRVQDSYPGNAGFTYEFHVSADTIQTGADSVLNYYPRAHGSFAEYVIIDDYVAGTCNDTLYLPGNTIVKGPLASFVSPAKICIDNSAAFINNSYPYYSQDTIKTWKWDFGDSGTDSVKNPQAHLYSNAGQYYVKLTATDISGCMHSKVQALTVGPVPRISAFPETDTICQSRDSAILRAYTVDTLLWMPATNLNCTTCDTIKAFPFVTTQYIARASNSFGCRSYDTCLVKVYPPIHLRVFPADTVVCTGYPVHYKLNSNGITSWLPATFLNDATIKNPTAIADSSMLYRVIVKDSAGCYADTATARLHIIAIPTVNAGPDRTLPYNSLFTISPVYSSNTRSYLWSPGTGVNCTNCPYLTGRFLQTTTFKIEATAVNGCKASDSITIFIDCSNTNLLLPTAFTPDNNGINDYFFPLTRGYRIIRKFLIFNRMGNKVFERQNFAPNTPALGWDGTIKGSDPATGTETYIWFVEAECERGQIASNKGTVVLIR
jgi:PKD repeat protein